MILPIRPLSGYKVKTVTLHDSNNITKPITKKIIQLLKKDYVEISKKNPTRNDFLEALLENFKQELPKGISHKTFAARVINKIKQTPAIKAEVESLSKVLDES